MPPGSRSLVDKLKSGDAPQSPLVVVANRLPVARSGDSWKRASGGLVTALAPIMERAKGAWIGWDDGSSGVPANVPDLSMKIVPVPLERALVNGYYHGFSNRTIWPLFHDLIQPPRFERTWWRHYQEANEHFARATIKQLKKMGPDATVWIHDYHLMLVPQMIRSKVEARILFFLHIPFPPPELFSRLPWRGAILEGLLGADVVGFHTDRYRKNFVRTCGRVLPDTQASGARVALPDGRMVNSSAHAISIDAQEFADAATTDRVKQEVETLRRQFAGKKVMLGVDRLDYTKGIPERLEAFEQLLEERSDLRGEIVLVQIAVPSRASVREYRELRGRVEQSVGRINGRFTEPGGDVPVHFLHRPVSRDRLVAYYSLADVMVITPLKDGMNLVAKEYVTCQGAVGGSGVLVLSEFTGAALELKGAVSCNPFDVDGLARALEVALELDPAEARKRMGTMARRVTKHDVHRWAAEMLADAGSSKRALPAEAHL
ncbi:MAG: alpha,alpha-trehalose-phosphate synthase (UDP-forming) [Actinomycetota bacterium]